MSDPIELVVGLNESNRLTLRFLGRTHAEPADYWDANCLRTHIGGTFGAFTVAVTVDLFADELVRFRRDLENLYEVVESEARFETMEGWLDLLFHGDGRGHVTVTGDVFDRVGHMGNMLRFMFEIDRTYLPPIIDSLHEVEAAWPLPREAPDQ